MAVAVSAERCVRGQLRTTEEFCTKCGTTVGLTLEWRPGVRLIDAGTFDDPSWISADRHQFRFFPALGAEVVQPAARGRPV